MAIRISTPKASSFSRMTKTITKTMSLIVLVNLIATTIPSGIVFVSASDTAAAKLKNVHTPGFEQSAATIMEKSALSFVSANSNQDGHISTDTNINAIRRKLLFSEDTNDPFQESKKKTQPIRIKFITAPIEEAIAKTTNVDEKIGGQSVIDNILPSIQKEFAEAISVKPTSGIEVPKQICDGIYSQYLSDNTRVNDADVVILVSSFITVTASNGDTAQWCSTDPNLTTLAAAITCGQDMDDGRPLVGLMNVCLSATSTESRTNMEEILAHELLHIFVLNEYLYPFYRNAQNGEALTANTDNIRMTKCVNGHQDRAFYPIDKNTAQYKTERVKANGGSENRAYYELTLPAVTQVVRNQFNCQSLTGARLENQPTNENSCFGSHFDERFFQYNIMSAIYDSTSAHFTPLTLALLEDSGWYKVDFSLADNSPFGLASGCGFATKDCIVDGEIPEYSQGNFCNDLRRDAIWSCDPGHNFRGLCDLVDYRFFTTTRPGREYFPNGYLGPQAHTRADFCPTVYKFFDYSAECTDVDGVKIDNIEVFSDNSRCMDVSINNAARTSVCLSGVCDNDAKEYVFEVGNTSYSCGFGDDGKKIESVKNGKKYSFTCPKLVQVCPDMFCPSMCSGKGICNWEAKPLPICECDDPDDSTLGCFESAPKYPNLASKPLMSMTILSVSLIAFIVSIF